MRHRSRASVFPKTADTVRAETPVVRCPWCREPIGVSRVVVTSLASGDRFYVHPDCKTPWEEDNANYYRERQDDYGGDW